MTTNGAEMPPKPGQQAKVDRSAQETEALAALAKAQNESKFWQLKYFELHQHTSQVIAALSQQTVLSAFAEQLKGLGVQQG